LPADQPGFSHHLAVLVYGAGVPVWSWDELGPQLVAQAAVIPLPRRPARPRGRPGLADRHHQHPRRRRNLPAHYPHDHLGPRHLPRLARRSLHPARGPARPVITLHHL